MPESSNILPKTSGYDFTQKQKAVSLSPLYLTRPETMMTPRIADNQVIVHLSNILIDVHT